MIDKLKEINLDHSVIENNIEMPLLDKDSLVMEKVMQLISQSKDNLNKINQNLGLLEEMKDYSKYSTQQNTDQYISLSMKKIIKNNTLFMEQNRKYLDMIRVISKTKTDKLSEDDYKIIQQNHDALVNQNQKIFQKTMEIQKGYKQQLQGKVKRQLEAVDDTLSSEQVDKLVEDPQKAQQMIQQKILGVPKLQLVN